LFQGKTKEAKILAQFEVKQQESEKQYLDNMKHKIDADYKVLQV
jgi:hypothetical protein